MPSDAAITENVSADNEILQNQVLEKAPDEPLEQLFSVYTMVDGIFVARGVSEVALSAVNIAMSFPVAMFSLSLMFALGNSTIVAILLGQKKKKQMRCFHRILW